MSDPYWPSRVFPRQPQPQQLYNPQPLQQPLNPQPLQQPLNPQPLQQPYGPAPVGKRPRFDPDEDDLPLYIPGLDGAHGGKSHGTEGQLIGASSSHYFPSYQPPPYDQGQLARPVSGGGSLNHLNNHPLIALGGPHQTAAVQERTLNLGTQWVDLPIVPSQHNSTLFVEGLALNCTEREVSHIFRPFGGFKVVRLVGKDPKPPRKDRTLLCFVEFTNRHHAAKAVEVLQGYKFDYTDPNSPTLKVEFARHQKPSAGSRGNR